MRIDKDTVARKLREQGEHDRAQLADCVLPRKVDTDQDAGLLHLLDVNVRDLAASESTDPEPSAGPDDG